MFVIAFFYYVNAKELIMSKSKGQKTVFFCTNCGNESSRWMGKCPQCGEWNSMIEEVVSSQVTKNRSHTGQGEGKRVKPTELASIVPADTLRISTNYKEVDRVLGGGIVPGSLILLGGDPGVGKSTLLLQISQAIAETTGKIWYASGEESQFQLKIRADRLGLAGREVIVTADTNLTRILTEASEEKPKFLVIDSIQTMYAEDIESAPGSVAQVKECTARLLRFAKEEQIPVVIIGHVTKDGSIAGPRMLEHMVDVVLYFEGERSYQFRILRSIKNRFGSTSETGIFSMEEHGLVELEDPSMALLSERREDESGSAVVAFLEGVRPILIEVQSLVVTTAFGMPRRTSIGYDLNRLIVLLAVLEKRSHIVLSNKDVYVNVIGGLKINEPACDLAMAIAIVSNMKDKPVPAHTVIMGEVGLTGNVRSIPRIEQRVYDAAKLGFTTFVIPEANVKQLKGIRKDLTIIGVSSVSEALECVFKE